MIYDVSVPIENSMPVWPSDPPVKLTAAAFPSAGGGTIRVTSIEMGSHTGTHIDAPCHFIDGARKLHEIPLERLVGETTVFHLPGVRSITRASLENLDWHGIRRVLFKTENSSHWSDKRFHEEFVYLEPEAAEFLADHGLYLVGIDYLSIDRFGSETYPAHLVLLPRDIVILEGLNLTMIAPGRYHMVALPLKLQDGDGAPARVILMNEK